ncbi:uncharacterized protein METZ01_LOCUS127056 [marine metagenome]|uniref:Uncharacterized protein n=1 Tax=marine metagenome TaxID=408172 RepID=A0A381YC86_9ZZZZ
MERFKGEWVKQNYSCDGNDQLVRLSLKL